MRNNYGTEVFLMIMLLTYLLIAFTIEETLPVFHSGRPLPADPPIEVQAQ